MSIRLLLAAFEDPQDSGKAAAAVLDHAEQAARGGRLPEEIDLRIIRLPFSHDRGAAAAIEALQQDPPEYFLLIGTDPTSTDYKLHVLAANYADDERTDVDHQSLKDTILDPEGPVAYRSRLPLDGIWDKFIVERVPVRMSHKAGLHVFNHVLYDVMRAVDLHDLPTRCGALEFPPLDEEAQNGAEGRTRDELEEEFHMVLAVLHQLAGAVEASAKDEAPEPTDTQV